MTNKIIFCDKKSENNFKTGIYEEFSSVRPIASIKLKDICWTKVQTGAEFSNPSVKTDDIGYLFYKTYH